MLNAKVTTLFFNNAVVELIDISDLRWTKELQVLLLNDMRNERRIKILSYRDDADKLRSAIWEYYVRQHYNISQESSLPQILRDKYGKPYIIGSKDYFNVSHSGKYVAIAYSNYPIGIDIERQRKWITKSIAKEICSKSELFDLKNTPNFSEHFIKLWVLKESYLKATGLGFLSDEPIPSFHVIGTEVYSNVNKASFILEEVENYFMSICVLNSVS